MTLLDPLETRRLLATYYVATTGLDTAAGSAAAPWQTLQHAADSVHAGDTVIVRAGTYRGFDVRTSGAANARITFRADPGVTINQNNPVTNRDGINIENADYITVENFTCIGTGDPLTSRAGIRIVGDGFDTGIFSRGVFVRNNRCDSWGYWGIFTGFTDDILIEGNECSRSAREHGIYFSNSADRPTIRGNKVWGNRANGIHMNGDIETGDPSLPAVDGIITGALIERNIIYGNGVGGGSGINCDGVQNSRIQDNLLYDNHASGIALYRIDGGAPSVNNVIVNNTIIHAADARWCVRIADASTGTTLFNNIFFNLNPGRGAYDLDSDCLTGLRSERNFIEGQFAIDGSFINLASWQTQAGNDSASTALTQPSMQALFVNYAANDFRLAPTSAAIDAGVSSFNGKDAPTYDLLLQRRPSGMGFDVGAYERATRINEAPFFTNAPVAEPAAFRGLTTRLSALADDDGGAANLKYAWTTVARPAGAPKPTFSVNGAADAAQTVVRFRAAGQYTFAVTVTDAEGGSVTGNVNVSVGQKLTAIFVSPNPRSLFLGMSQRFVATAVDQFGRPMAVQPAFTWTKTGIGRLNPTGRYYAPADIAGFATIRAAGGGTRGSASVTVVAPAAPMLRSAGPLIPPLFEDLI